MPAYTPPLDEFRFVIHDVIGTAEMQSWPAFAEFSPDLADAILTEAGRLGADVLEPLNRVGDTTGCVLENGVVRTPDGFADAYRQFVEGGWNGIAADAETGGQGVPQLVATAVGEIWAAANTAFSLCPTLGQAAIELMENFGTEEQKATYLPKIVSGEWTCTMNLTEPQAGTDLGRIRTKSERDPGSAGASGGHYRITGQKIFITYGEHDFTDNIIHFVLARSPDGTPGTKGLSLFIVPKFLVNEDGSLGDRNDLRCVSLEHKLGIHASPTCVMSYGDDGGAIGFLVGEENQGLPCMFSMMNHTRLSVGLQGVGIGERAFQHARDYARERIQGRRPNGEGEADATIVQHPDVRRMLLEMKSRTEAIRALALYTASCIDAAKHHPDEQTRAESLALVELLTPLVKAWPSDTGIEIASTGIQVHGGMGYIEETGAAQYFRDSRIAAIYEGTNAIQANDLVGRKIARGDGVALAALKDAMTATVGELAGHTDPAVQGIAKRLAASIDAWDQATKWLLETAPKDPDAVLAGAVTYLRMMATTVGGWLMARSAAVAAAKQTEGGGDPKFLGGKITSARFFADHELSKVPALADIWMHGADAIAALDDESL